MSQIGKALRGHELARDGLPPTPAAPLTPLWSAPFVAWEAFTAEPHWLGPDNGGIVGRLQANNNSEVSFAYVAGVNKSASRVILSFWASDYTCAAGNIWTFTLYQDGAPTVISASIASVPVSPGAGLFIASDVGSIAIAEGTRFGIVLSSSNLGAPSANLRAAGTITVSG